MHGFWLVYGEPSQGLPTMLASSAPFCMLSATRIKRHAQRASSCVPLWCEVCVLCTLCGSVVLLRARVLLCTGLGGAAQLALAVCILCIACKASLPGGRRDPCCRGASAHRRARVATYACASGISWHMAWHGHVVARALLLLLLLAQHMASILEQDHSLPIPEAYQHQFCRHRSAMPAACPRWAAVGCVAAPGRG